MAEKILNESRERELETIPYDDLREEIVKRAPESGRMLAYFQKEVLDERYQSRKELEQKLKERNSMVLEIHLFDHCQEVRAIWSRRVGEYIYHPNHVEEEELRKDYSKSMVEQVVTKKEKGNITIVNQLSYDKKGMITIEDFCLLDKGVEV